MRFDRRLLLLFAATLGLAAATAAAATPAPLDNDLTAAWTQQKFQFVVLGFQTRYTCEGLRTYIRQIVLGLGARREDLDVHEVGCSRNHPSSVAASFWMLEPVPGARASAVPAHWEEVRIPLGGGSSSDLGGCELAHQAMQQILPYFTVRKAAFDPDCTEHHAVATPYGVRAEVLLPGSAPRTVP